jgi:hypothetical protein
LTNRNFRAKLYFVSGRSVSVIWVLLVVGSIPTQGASLGSSVGRAAEFIERDSSSGTTF